MIVEFVLRTFGLRAALLPLSVSQPAADGPSPNTVSFPKAYAHPWQQGCLHPKAAAGLPHYGLEVF
jgi:hypothetical protein